MFIDGIIRQVLKDVGEIVDIRRDIVVSCEASKTVIEEVYSDWITRGY